MCAAEAGEYDAVTVLMEHGADPEIRAKDTGNTALMLAATRGHDIVIKRLVECKVDLHAENLEGETARTLAANNQS